MAACVAEIERAAEHPSTVDIDAIRGVATKVYNNGNRMVRQSFNAKNSYNLTLKFDARCIVSPNGYADVTITERQ